MALQSGSDSRTMRGGTIPGTRQPAFTLVTPKAPALPVILAAPHGGRTYPEALWAAMRQPVSSALALEDRLVDRLARESGTRTGAAVLTAQAPRAMIDLNRAPNEIDWTMVAEGAPGGAGADKANGAGANRRVRSGLGLVPRRVAGLGEIWRRPLTGAALDARIGQVHAPYHAALGQTLAEYRDLFGAVLLLDVHSMPPLKSPEAGQVAGQAAADYVIGDRFGAAASDRLAAIALRVLSSAQARSGQAGSQQAGPCAHNRPYAGGYVLERHADPAGGIHAMQLEISRDLYLDSRAR